MKELYINDDGLFVMSTPVISVIAAVDRITKDNYDVKLADTLSLFIERKRDRFYLIDMKYGGTTTRVVNATFVNADNTYKDLDLFKSFMDLMRHHIELSNAIKYNGYANFCHLFIPHLNDEDEEMPWTELEGVEDDIEKKNEYLKSLLTRTNTRYNARGQDENMYEWCRSAVDKDGNVIWMVTTTGNSDCKIIY